MRKWGKDPIFSSPKKRLCVVYCSANPDKKTAATGEVKKVYHQESQELRSWLNKNRKMHT